MNQQIDISSGIIVTSLVSNLVFLHLYQPCGFKTFCNRTTVKYLIKLFWTGGSMLDAACNLLQGVIA